MTELTTVAAPKGAQDALEELVRKMYISNVSKRLRELNQPTVTDKKRWIWELIQNAKDTIAGDPNRNSINVRIQIDGDEVTFIHDGNPFTLNARFGLLWKYSEAKENQESTGRFGTGFLTTHCLSKVVSRILKAMFMKTRILIIFLVSELLCFAMGIPNPNSLKVWIK